MSLFVTRYRFGAGYHIANGARVFRSLREIAEWLRERAGGGDLLVLGCTGVVHEVRV